MGAPKGNQFYLLRSKDGKDKKYKPIQLLTKAYEYFNWCNENPLTINENKGTKNVNTVKKVRPFSKKGFCHFADITPQTLENYKVDKDYLGIIHKIETAIEVQQFDYATIGEFNHNIIARKLGLTDKKEHSGPDGKPIPVGKSLSEEEADDIIRRYKQMKKRKKK